MSDFKKSVLNAILGLVNMGAVGLLWQHPVVLTLILLILSVAMLAVRGSYRIFSVWVIGFIFGPIAEVIAMETGAWTYAEPHLYTIPIWLPFLWANAALFIVNTEKLVHVLFPRASASEK